MKPIKTLVLLADDGRARLFENLGPGTGLVEVIDLSVSTLDPESLRFADRAGRGQAAPGMAQHAAFDQAEAEHDRLEGLFAKAVIAETEGRFADGGYERFVVAAAPGMLGVLRKGLPKRLKDALVADVAKDLLKMKPAEVVEHLADQIAL